MGGKGSLRGGSRALPIAPNPRVRSRGLHRRRDRSRSRSRSDLDIDIGTHELPVDGHAAVIGRGGAAAMLRVQMEEAIDDVLDVLRDGAAKWGEQVTPQHTSFRCAARGADRIADSL